MNFDSKTVSRAAITMAMSFDRDDEKKLQVGFLQNEMKCAAVDFGGEFISSINKIIERTIVAANRENIIKETHLEEGSVAGATREAITQIMNKAIGLNVGGKIGIARCQNHIAVALLFGIGLLHLDEISIGLGHRAI